MEFRLAAFYFLFFAYAGGYVAYFPLYLASRDLSAVEIAGVLALPAIARIIVPTAWGSVADRTGADAEGEALRGGSWFVIPAVVLVAIILAVLRFDDDDDDLPNSP